MVWFTRLALARALGAWSLYARFVSGRGRAIPDPSARRPLLNSDPLSGCSATYALFEARIRGKAFPFLYTLGTIQIDAVRKQEEGERPSFPFLYTLGTIYTNRCCAHAARMLRSFLNCVYGTRCNFCCRSRGDLACQLSRHDPVAYYFTVLDFPWL